MDAESLLVVSDAVGVPERSATILVVDDEPTNLDVLFHYLERAGFRVRVANNGQAALDQIKRVQPDLILLDVMMPGLDGFETCRRLKADVISAAIPVIFMTALTDTDHKVNGFAVGAVDYVTKPPQYAEVLARVETHLTMRRLQQRLQEKNERLEQEIAERKRVEIELRRLNEDLDAFAQTVAHDLRNPLGAMAVLAELAAEEAADITSEQVRDYLDDIKTGSRRGLNIVEELLTLSSVRQQSVSSDPIDMAAVVAAARERLSDLITQSQAVIDLPEAWPTALGHAPWIEEVWVNYLSNGLKYGGRPPHLILGSTRQADGAIRFWVQDNGPGLSIDVQGDLFQPFTQVSQVRAQGHGLGLSIVRRIIEKLEGTVGVESQPGRGSTFSFTLPAVSIRQKAALRE